MRIGSFRAALREADPDYEPDTIEVCGQDFRVADSLPLAVFLKFGYTASGGGEDSEEGMQDLSNMVACIFYDDDEAKRFLTMASRERLDSEIIGDIIRSVIAHLSARPTKRQSSSQTGLSETSTNTNTESVPLPESIPDLTSVNVLTPEELNGLGVTTTG